MYFQDEYPKDKVPNHDYFFNILNTIYPEYTKQITENAANQRFTTDGIEAKKEAIKVTDEIWEELQAMPHVSRKQT